MKTKLIYSVLALVLVMIGVSSAYAWTDQVERATIPFDFYAGKRMMPAGTYNIKLDLEDNMVSLSNISDQSTVFLMGVPPGDDGGDQSELVFDRSGDSYFLRELKSNVLDESFPTRHAHASRMEAVVVPLT